MRTSDSLQKLAPALTQALAAVHNATKDSKNPHFKSTYASLAAVIDATKDTLASHGLVVVQAPGWSDGRVTVTSRIIHSSGEWIESVAEAPIPKADPQGVGSAVTYLRRYSLAALCGITQEDDDGNQASAPKPERARRPIKGPAPEVAEAQAALQVLAMAANLDGALTVKELEHVQKAIDSGDLGMIGRATSFVQDKHGTVDAS
jgi:hypothetical protein